LFLCVSNLDDSTKVPADFVGVDFVIETACKIQKEKSFHLHEESFCSQSLININNGLGLNLAFEMTTNLLESSF
jgi:hypothetical protein